MFPGSQVPGAGPGLHLRPSSLIQRPRKRPRGPSGTWIVTFLGGRMAVLTLQILWLCEPNSRDRKVRRELAFPEVVMEMEKLKFK